MSPKDIVFTTKPFEYEAFVTSISDSKTVPSFEGGLRSLTKNRVFIAYKLHNTVSSNQPLCLRLQLLLIIVPLAPTTMELATTMGEINN